MCLGHTAKDEFNIVELITGEGNSSAKAVPIATLHAKSMPTVRNIHIHVISVLAEIHTMLQVALSLIWFSSLLFSP